MEHTHAEEQPGSLKPFWKVLALGALTGMRSMAGPAIASHVLSRRHSAQLAQSSLRFMQSPRTANITKLFALGESTADKIPQAPSRTAVAGLIGRIAAGTLVGASIYKSAGCNAAAGALLGAITAVGTTFGSFYLRKFIVERTGAMDPHIGAIEDMIVAGGAALIIKA